MLSGNLAGEETVSQSNLVWITKTHWPMESPFGNTKFSAQKVISVVRNPIDVVPSFALLVNTTSHSMTLKKPINEVDPVWWNIF